LTTSKTSIREEGGLGGNQKKGPTGISAKDAVGGVGYDRPGMERAGVDSHIKKPSFGPARDFKKADTGAVVSQYQNNPGGRCAGRGGVGKHQVPFLSLNQSQKGGTAWGLHISETKTSSEGDPRFDVKKKTSTPLWYRGGGKTKKEGNQEKNDPG